jgi:hypothetical protein
MMRLFKQLQSYFIVLVFLSTSTLCRADVTLVLNKSFVNKIKNKATVTTSLNVDAHPNTPHPIKSSGNDGDIHMAGRDTIFKLPLVAEIINARLEAAAMNLLKQSSPQQPLNVTGVWRIWFEHLGKKDQVQGDPVPAPGDSNPDHLCEIHPITKFGSIDVLNSFVEIKNNNVSPPKSYEAYTASKAFPFYDDIDATIKASNTAISITSGEGKYNYTEFVMELAGKPKDVGDGFVVLAHIFDKDDVDQPASPDLRRMIFVKGTPPANKLASLTKGEQVHVLGIPRVNLAEVSAIASQNGNEETDVKLPYEMIIVAILPD